MADTRHISNQRTHQNVCPIMLPSKYCKRWHFMHIYLMFMIIYTTMQISSDGIQNRFWQKSKYWRAKEEICVQNEVPKWLDMSSRNKKALQNYFQFQNVKKLKKKKKRFTKSYLNKSAQPWMHTFSLCVEFSHPISSVI